MTSLLWLTLRAADPARFSSQSLGSFKGHYAVLAHRQGNGGAERNGYLRGRDRLGQADRRRKNRSPQNRRAA